MSRTWMCSNRSRTLWAGCSHVPGPLWTRACYPNTIRWALPGIEVKPKVYLALGISGAFQHVGGIKGSPLIVAVNKDARGSDLQSRPIRYRGRPEPGSPGPGRKNQRTEGSRPRAGRGREEKIPGGNPFAKGFPPRTPFRKLLLYSRSRLPGLANEDTMSLSPVIPRAISLVPMLSKWYYNRTSRTGILPVMCLLIAWQSPEYSFPAMNEEQHPGNAGGKMIDKIVQRSGELFESGMY